MFVYFVLTLTNNLFVKEYSIFQTGSEGNKRLNLLSDKKIVRHTKLKLDMNPYLDKDYFILRKIKLGVKKLTNQANRVWDKTKKDWQPETETMINNCCPI